LSDIQSCDVNNRKIFFVISLKIGGNHIKAVSQKHTSVQLVLRISSIIHGTIEKKPQGWNTMPRQFFPGRNFLVWQSMQIKGQEILPIFKTELNFFHWELSGKIALPLLVFSQDSLTFSEDRMPVNCLYH
jgi:hypothetical protein